MSVDKKISYKDQRLTKAQQKKTKPINSAGIKNYFNKSKTVTVPKKWLSSPDHVVAELAYITPREQKILLDADLYGSLKGKPNRGPGGIMSLQGGGSGWGGGNQDNSENQGGGYSCFIAGTKVTMADGTFKNIEEIIVGDKIKGHKNDNEVIKLDPTLLANRKLYSFNNNEHYFFTSEHPFMTEEGWKSVKPEKTKERDGIELYNQLEGELKIGDKLVTDKGLIEITDIKSKEINKPDMPLYNFNVSNDNSYIADGYVVHNKGGSSKPDNNPAPDNDDNRYEDQSYEPPAPPAYEDQSYEPPAAPPAFDNLYDEVALVPQPPEVPIDPGFIEAIEDVTKGTLSDPEEKLDFVGDTIFGPSQKYTGDSSLFGGANKYGYTDQYTDPTKTNFGDTKPGYGGKIFGGLFGLATGIPFIGSAIGNTYDKGKGFFSTQPQDMSKYNNLGLYTERPQFTGKYGTPTLQGDYDIYGNKINELTGEILDPVTGEVIDIIPGYPEDPDGGITTIPIEDDGSDQYVDLIDQYVPDDPTIPNNAFDFKSRFLQNRTKEEREAIEKDIQERFKDFDLGDMDGS